MSALRIALPWRLEVRTETGGRWTHCGRYRSSGEALRHGLAVLEILSGVQCLDGVELFRPREGSLRIEEVTA